jgi:hypothetical protein
VNTEVYRGYTINIEHDECYSETPEECDDNDLFLACFNKRELWVVKTYERVFGKVSVEASDADLVEQYERFRVRGYSHSGIGLSLSDLRYPFNCPWDSGWWGYVFVRKAAYPEAARRVEVAKALIQAWNDVLQGNVWGFVIAGPTGEEVESCWGFVGDPEVCLAEAKRVVDATIARVEGGQWRTLRAAEAMAGL